MVVARLNTFYETSRVAYSIVSVCKHIRLGRFVVYEAGITPTRSWITVMKIKDSNDGRTRSGPAEVVRLVPRLHLVPPLTSGAVLVELFQAPGDVPPTLTIVETPEQDTSGRE